MQKKVFLFIGAPGSGKGTQAALLVSRMNAAHISTGDLLRSEVAQKSELGLKISSIVSSGQLVDDEIMIDLIKIHCSGLHSTLILDGFPRNLKQARSLVESSIFNQGEILSVFFNIDLLELRDRLVNRRSCPDCGEIYNLKFKPQAVNGKCDKCSSLRPLIHRADDTEEVVEKRLSLYKENAEAMKTYFGELGLLLNVDASLPQENVYLDLIDGMNLKNY